MKGKFVLILLALTGWIFFHYFNANQILRSTQELSQLEKTFQAERNINTELMIEHDDLVSGRNVSSLVPEEMMKYVSKEIAGNVIYIQEPAKQKTPTYYCIIDLLTPKAEAATTTVIPD
jgi:hypothetical protein